MIIHQLILQHLKTGDNVDFYRLQAEDAVRWMAKSGIQFGKSTKALDLGCGHGLFGKHLKEKECRVVFADETNTLDPALSAEPFRKTDIEADDLRDLGQFDLVVCSNVLEHLRSPEKFIDQIPMLLKSNGAAYVSWTNWLSPWGGHEFSPFHYLGPTMGPRIYDRLTGRKRIHTPFQNLFPTYIGAVLQTIRRHPELVIQHICPRYYSELSFLMKIPVLREFVAWNCAILVAKRPASE